MKVITLFISLILSALLSTLNAQQVLTFSDKDSLRAGELFELTFVVDGNYSSLSYPTIDDFEDDLDIISRQRFQVAANRDSLVYTIQFFATKNITISPKTIQLSGGDVDTILTTSRVPLFFKATVTDADDEFRALKPIFDFARALWPIILFLIILLTSAILFYRWYHNQEPASEPKPIKKPLPFVHPLNQLKKSLNALPNTTALDQKSDYEQYYIKLGDAIRLYIKRVYQFPALEMTTREITDNLRSDLANNELIKITRSVLNEADMVKFANFKPTQDLAEKVFDKANQFVKTATESDRQRIDYMVLQHQEEQDNIVQQSNDKSLNQQKKEGSNELG